MVYKLYFNKVVLKNKIPTGIDEKSNKENAASCGVSCNVKLDIYLSSADRPWTTCCNRWFPGSVF